ncbi:hypothetical protein DSO57_1004973 [Entomophthora muscae]|uniref:Uncharacterized protein n=1 Tax=Entomophthora muscae TaxID=34485 RepID=A0ACC2U5V3_9FUNG|nr:hypothetical protein DSO57_1004973 [Entomophthora muscae]
MKSHQGVKLTAVAHYSYRFGELHGTQLWTLIFTQAVPILRYQVNTHPMMGLTHWPSGTHPKSPNASTYAWLTDSGVLTGSLSSIMGAKSKFVWVSQQELCSLSLRRS